MPLITPYYKFKTITHDYGTILQDADGNCEFRFTNTGNENLILQSVVSNCGCAIPIFWSKEPILPRTESVIKVRYDTHRIGPFSKIVTVTFKGKTEKVVLTIKGIVASNSEQITYKNGNPKIYKESTVSSSQEKETFTDSRDSKTYKNENPKISKDSTVSSAQEKGTFTNKNVNPEVQNKPEVFAEKAWNLFYKENKKDSAIILLKKALTIYPKDVPTLTWLGTFYNETQQYDKAKATWDKALLVEPKNIACLVYKSLSCYHLKQFQTVENCLNKALLIDPKNFATYSYMLQIHYLMGLYKKVISEVSIYRNLGQAIDDILVYGLISESLLRQFNKINLLQLLGIPLIIHFLTWHSQKSNHLGLNNYALQILMID